MKTKPSSNASISNIYKLDGQVPLGKAIPFGIQHILAMFVSNLTPIILIGTASGLDQAKTALLLQNAMFIAGIATLIQLYPLWRIGSGLPIVMGVSFTFVTILTYVGGSYGYGAVVGTVLIGGVMEGTLGLLAKYWRRIITPVVAAAVVTTIGYFCKVLLETVICAFWIDCWLHFGFCYGHGGFLRYPGKRISCTSFSSAHYAGISCRRYCFCGYYLPGICSGNHW